MAYEKVAKSAYGKRPVWQWLLIYLLVGGIIYFLIYLFLSGKSGGYNSNYSSPGQSSFKY